MSTFEVKVRKITVSPHPDPETTELEVGQVDGYNVVIRKGQYITGDLVVYIPEASILPETLIEEMGLTGRLAGSSKNRVKAIKLRKILSQGLCYPPRDGWFEGMDVTEELGITKWIPTIPANMAGEVSRAVIYSQDRSESEIKFNFDIENIKKHPSLFSDKDDVIITEKIHGTFMVIGYMPENLRHPDMIDGKFFVSSKGLASRGMFLKDNEKNRDNVYVKTVKDESLNLRDNLESLEAMLLLDGRKSADTPVWLVGEVFGNGIQDLKYGQEGTSYRSFGVKIGDKWIDYDDFLDIAYTFDIPTVPVLYRGKFSDDIVKKFTDGKTIAGKGCHIREGVVVCSTSCDDEGTRKILKSVSEKYLLRKNSDATEFE